MDFIGSLNFVNPVVQADGSDEHRKAFAATRLGRPTRIHDARATAGLMEEPVDSTRLLADGVGFLLAHAPSAVGDWTDIEEVADVYYEEAGNCCRNSSPRQRLRPPAATRNGTSRSRNTIGRTAFSTVRALRASTTTTPTSSPMTVRSSRSSPRSKGCPRTDACWASTFGVLCRRNPWRVSHWQCATVPP